MNVRRGIEATVSPQAIAHYTIKSADAVQTMPVPEITSVVLTLVDAKNVATPLAAKPWNGSSMAVKIPEVPDGD